LNMGAFTLPMLYPSLPCFTPVLSIINCSLPHKTADGRSAGAGPDQLQDQRGGQVGGVSVAINLQLLFRPRPGFPMLQGTEARQSFLQPRPTSYVMHARERLVILDGGVGGLTWFFCSCLNVPDLILWFGHGRQTATVGNRILQPPGSNLGG